ncbi:hypothetical protein T439DRAFT_379067 [Meredithblackwellia eburnea MCA 4105]
MLKASAILMFATAQLVVVGLALPEPQEQSSLEKRYTTLSDGSYYTSGAISSTLRWLEFWLTGDAMPSIASKTVMYESATGMLESTTNSDSSRRSLPSTEELAALNDDDLESYFEAFPEQAVVERSDIAISDEELGVTRTKRQVTSTCGGSGGGGATGTPTPPSPRQRIEFLSWPGAPANTEWIYRWSTYLVPGVSTSAHFFHTWQVLRRDACGGPVLTLDAKAGKAVIGDLVRGCTECASVPIASFTGKTIVHAMRIRYGINGLVSYKAVDINNQKTPLLSYSATGDMGASASIKFGMYRGVFSGNTEARSFVGDYSATRVA